MKLILVAVVLIFTIKMTVAESDEDSIESHDLQNGEVNTNTTLTLNSTPLPNKARKFVVTLKKPTKTSFVLPKRGSQRNRVSKFQIQHNIPRGNTSYVSTKRPHLMEAKRFTSKPHAIDHVEKLIERTNFKKRRTESKFNQLNTEEKHKISEQNNHSAKKSEKFENRFQNFTDVDNSNENDSDESKETNKPLRRRYMKTAASNKVKAIASPSFINGNTQRNYKIKDLLKNQKYFPKVERKMVPVLALQKGNSSVGSQNDTTVLVQSNINEVPSKKSDLSPEENADQNEFIFVKDGTQKSSTTAKPEDEEIVTDDPINTN